jgi:hypothetical protein
MSTYPSLTRSPGSSGFVETLPEEDRAIGSKASGLPVINELFTFTPIEWKFTRYLVSQTDKETVVTFYKNNKGVPFDWYNEQDGNTYEVIYLVPPECSLDKVKLRWKIVENFRQYSPLT